jgi:hypothetical protein
MFLGLQSRRRMPGRRFVAVIAIVARRASSLKGRANWKAVV